MLLRVRVQPRASRDALSVDSGDRIRVALSAPPVDGAANKALVAFLAKTLGVRKAAISLETGAKSREKTLRIKGVSMAALRDRIGLTEAKRDTRKE